MQEYNIFISVYIYTHVCQKSFHYPGSPRRNLAKCTNNKKNGTMLHLAACRKVATTGCYRLSAPQNFLGSMLLITQEFFKRDFKSSPGTDIKKWVFTKVVYTSIYGQLKGNMMNNNRSSVASFSDRPKCLLICREYIDRSTDHL